MLVDFLRFVAAPIPTVPVHYLPIRELEVIHTADGLWPRILCEDDQGGPTYSVSCLSWQIPFLDPYLALYRAWLDDPLQYEAPVLPVVFLHTGVAHFTELDFHGRDARDSTHTG